MSKTEIEDMLNETIETGEDFVILKQGNPVAVVIPYDEYESLTQSVGVVNHG